MPLTLTKSAKTRNIGDKTLKIYRILQLPDRCSGLRARLPGAAAGPRLGSAAGLPAALGAAAGARARPGARAPRLGPGSGAGTTRPGPGSRPREAVKKCIKQPQITKVITKRQCWGSGSAFFWDSRIRLRIH
jgi:hypothetical protein